MFIKNMKNRNHSLDLLRIIAMFMILTAHILGWGGAINTICSNELNYYPLMSVYFISQIGTVLFFLLSGYFASEKFRFKSILFLERKTAFYAIVISAITILLGMNKELSWFYVLYCEFPVLLNRYWFISVYVILSVLSPVLVRGLNKCSEKLVIVLIIALLLNNTFLYQANMTLYQGIHLFIIGYYIKRFSPFARLNKSVTALIYLLSLGIYVAERFAVQRIGQEHTKLDEGLRYILILIMAVFFFAFFEKLDIKSIFPSLISGNIIAVYLITACPAIMHPLYEKWLFIGEFCHEYWFIGYFLAIGIVMFSVSIIIDKAVTFINNKETEFWIGLLKRIKVIKE